MQDDNGVKHGGPMHTKKIENFASKAALMEQAYALFGTLILAK